MCNAPKLQSSKSPNLQISKAPNLQISISEPAALLLICMSLKCCRVLQKRGTQKKTFEFVYLGTFNMEIWKANRDLGLQSVELCPGTHGYQYALIRIVTKKRASQVQKIFEGYDRVATPGMQIKLTRLPKEPVIVGFGHGYDFMDHTIYKVIERARETRNPGYFYWSHDSRDQNASASSSSKATAKLRRLLETDMVPSMFNPTCPKQQRATRTKNSSTVQLEGRISFSYD